MSNHLFLVMNPKGTVCDVGIHLVHVHTFSHSFTHKGNLSQPVHLMACFWEVGEHHMSQIGMHRNFIQTVTQSQDFFNTEKLIYSD